jgi:predicted Zn-dependent protease
VNSPWRNDWIWLLAAAALLLPAACAMNPATGRPDFVLMSEKDELVLGYRYSKEIKTSYSRYENAQLQEYVDHVGDELVDVSHRSEIRYRFTVLDSSEVNAFALPGGYIYITRGLMAYLNSEAELAAVIAHEIGHVTARHAVRQHSLQTAANSTVVLGSLLLPEVAALGQGVYGLLGGALFSGYGREHELEADGLGAEYIARAGYDPMAMIDVIEVLKQQELFEKARAEQEGRPPRVYHGVFASHPSNDQRLQEAVASAAKEARESGGRVERVDYLEQLDGLSFGRSTRQGIVKGRDFHHRGLGIGLEIPLGWHVENATGRLIASTLGNEEVIEVSQQQRRGSLTPLHFAEEQLGLSAIEDGEELRINGLPSYTGTAPRDTPVGKRRTRFVVIFLANRAYLFQALAEAKKEQADADAELLETARSFRLLTKEERDLAGEKRIRLREVAPNTSYAELEKASPIGDHAEEMLRLLNDDYPSGEPQPGTLIKVVE